MLIKKIEEFMAQPDATGNRLVGEAEVSEAFREGTGLESQVLWNRRAINTLSDAKAPW